jgi:hypothetical protein
MVQEKQQQKTMSIVEDVKLLNIYCLKALSPRAGTPCIAITILVF